MKRYAIVRNARTRSEAAAYLPGNYEIIHEGAETSDEGTSSTVQVIAGEDVAGWTLDDYVIPRYASGLIWTEEIDLSHPLMKEVGEREPLAEKLRRAAVVLRELGGEENYDLADACEDAAREEVTV